MRKVNFRTRVDGQSEERFLDCADRLLRRSEVGGKSRSAPLGMTGFFWFFLFSRLITGRFFYSEAHNCEPWGPRQLGRGVNLRTQVQGHLAINSRTSWRSY